VAVISVGTDNSFGHPSPEVVERLIDRLGEDNVYRTDKDGTVEFITDGERLWVRNQEKLAKVYGRGISAFIFLRFA
jgi:competence protein ComEC